MSRVSWWVTKAKDLRVKVWGNIALSTATPTLTGDSKAGKHYDNVVFRHTAVWEKKRGHWQIIHDHWSIPLPSPKPKS